MANSKLFEYAVIYHPKVTRDQNGNETQGPDLLLVEPTHALAQKQEEVAIKAARAIPDQYLDKLDQVEIVVRPFASA